MDPLPSALYLQICAWTNLLSAWRKARKGKRGRPAAASFELTAGESLLELERELLAQRYQPGSYASFTIHDPKRRLISAAPFRDRVVHHALCNVIEPLFERRFIHDNYANRRGRGTHAALDRCQAFTRRYRYVLPCDVAQFFPAIDHQILLTLLGKVIREADVLWLCRQILDSGRGVLDGEYTLRSFPGDDLFAVLRPRGLPIGNLTSQFWANVYLDPLDHFIKRELRCQAYLRYVDDFLLFDDSKAQLWTWRQAIVERLAALRLTLHEQRCHPRPVTEGTPFLGWVVYPHHRLLKRRRGITYRRRLRGHLQGMRKGDVSWEELFASIQGWVNHVRWGSTHGLRRKLFREHPIIPARRKGRR